MAVCVALSCCSSATAETWRLKDGDRWESVASDPQERYLHAISELKELARAGEAGEVKEALKQIKEEFPDRVGPDLDLFINGELQYWRDHYGKALGKFEKMLKNYAGSEFSAPALQREFDMAQAYLQGRKKTVLGLFKISGYAEGVSLMEKVSDRAGLDEPNGVGLRAAIAVAEHFEARGKYLEAYLKWSEIASYWETGPLGKRALYRMAEDNLAAYDQPSEPKRPNYDASKLTTARTYYAKFLALYPEDATENDVPDKMQHIDEEMALKQLTIGQFYRRTHKHQAANLYFDMVVRNWPNTEAGAMAKEALDKDQAGGK
ncbi:MAG: outer membrane protein assembly factor BamD [Phycisphaerae bacterium]|nr:outer membrane protein assembly factor BamD [Phycisphaerae bacterium]